MPTEEFFETSEKLKQILGNAHCPMCGNNQFVIAEGYTTLPVQRSLNEFQIGGPSIPCISLICTKCGHVSTHAVGALGGLNKEQSGHSKAE